MRLLTIVKEHLAIIIQRRTNANEHKDNADSNQNNPASQDCGLERGAMKEVWRLPIGIRA